MLKRTQKGDLTSRQILGTETNGGNLRDMLGTFFHLMSSDKQHAVEPETQLSRVFPSSGEVVCAKDLVGESCEIFFDEPEEEMEKSSSQASDDPEALVIYEKPCQEPWSLCKAFEDEFRNRSATWVYDWFYDLKDSQDADRSKKYLKLSKISIVKLIREELHHLHTKMVMDNSFVFTSTS